MSADVPVSVGCSRPVCRPRPDRYCPFQSRRRRRRDDGGVETRLTVELVPSTCWYTNVRNHVPKAVWDRLRRQVAAEAGIRGVAVYDRSIWPNRDGNCPAGPSHCVTSIAALRAAQKTGQASVDVPSNVYFYFAVHPEER